MFSFTTERKALSASGALAVVVLYISFVSLGECQTTPPPLAPCSTYKKCDTCVPHAKCLWCFATNNCTEYPVTWLLPPASVCQLSQARWGVCWYMVRPVLRIWLIRTKRGLVNFEALIIALGVLGGTLLISIIACCCCCCFCKTCRSRPDRDEERFSRKREEIRQRAEERKVDRKARHDEIRRKYGLVGDSDHPYSKFENE